MRAEPHPLFFPDSEVKEVNMNARESITVDVVAVEQLTPLIKRFTFALPDGAPLPAFNGGAHVLVSMQDGEAWRHNAYSLLSSPHDTRQYQIAVRREEASRGGSAFMHDKVEAGTRLAIGSPANLFELASGAKRHVFIAGGIGITPFMSIVRHGASAGDARRRVLVYSNHRPEDAAFLAELDALSKARAGLHVIPTMTAMHRSASHWAGESRRLDAAMVKAAVEGLSRPIAYLAGPPEMVAAAREILAAAGIDEDDVRAEEFFGY